ncbi:MAG TPA: SCO1664 family protein [Marmoricola sp.]
MSSLETDPLVVLGRIMPASNQTFLCALGDEDAEDRVVYKPIAGERPLWDFPDATLAGREYAAWLVSDALGWDVVPRTILREGPHGPGMVQVWVDIDETADPVAVVRPADRPDGYLHVLDAEDDRGRTVELVHEDTPELLAMAVFDLLVNNTDRKGGHVLPLPDGRRQGVDHGICFHTDDKLRTVLWGFHDRAVPAELLPAIARIADDRALIDELGWYLNADEVAAFGRRCRRVIDHPTMPALGPGWPSIPWPPF